MKHATRLYVFPQICIWRVNRSGNETVFCLLSALSKIDEQGISALKKPSSVLGEQSPPAGFLLADRADGVAFIIMRREDERLVGKLQQSPEDRFVLRARIAILEIGSPCTPYQQRVAGEHAIGHGEAVGIVGVTWRIEDIESNALYLYLVSIINPHLAEIRSITVDQNYQKRGGGELLVQSLMSEARKHQVSCICLFTRSSQFFAKLGFDVAQREDLPDKINKDCCVCPRYHCCDEVGMVKGELPRFAILPEPANFLVKLQI